MIHHIYREMRSKQGFDGGSTVPEGVAAVREELISLINKGLPENSAIEAYPLNRPGIHNWCMIGYRNKNTKNESNEPGDEVYRTLYKAEEEGWSIYTRITIRKTGS